MAGTDFAGGFARGLTTTWLAQQQRKQQKEQEQKRLMLQAADYLIKSGRVADYSDLAPIFDNIFGEQKGGKGKGGKKGENSPQALLQQYLTPALKGGTLSGAGQPLLPGPAAKQPDQSAEGDPGAGIQTPPPTAADAATAAASPNRGITGQGFGAASPEGGPGAGSPQGEGAPGGGGGAPAPLPSRPVEAPGATAGQATAAAAPRGPLGVRMLTDEQLGARKRAEARLEDIDKQQSFLDQVREVRKREPGLSFEHAYELVSRGFISQPHETAPKTLGKAVPASSIAPEERLDASDKPIPDNIKNLQPITLSDGKGGYKIRYQPAGAATLDFSKLDPKLRTAVESRLASMNIDPQTADRNDPVVQKALQKAGEQVMKESSTHDQSEAASLMNKLINAGVIGRGGGPPGQGNDRPIVSMGSDSRPDPEAQAQFLQSLPSSEQRALVKGIADYSINPTTLSNRTTAGKGGGLTRAEALALVKEYDPTYSESLYNARAKVTNDWTSGKTRDAMVATNTVVRHLDELSDAIKDLAPYTSAYGPEVNRVKFMISRRNDPKARDAMRKFETARDAVAEELRKVYAGTGGGALEEVKQWQENASLYSPTDDKRTFIQTAANLMFGKVNSAADNYRAAMGKNPPVGQALSQTSVSVLKRLGVDTSKLDSALGTDPAGLFK